MCQCTVVNANVDWLKYDAQNPFSQKGLGHHISRQPYSLTKEDNMADATHKAVNTSIKIDIFSILWVVSRCSERAQTILKFYGSWQSQDIHVFQSTYKLQRQNCALFQLKSHILHHIVCKDYKTQSFTKTTKIHTLHQETKI